MRLTVLQNIKANNLQDFITFWARLYSYPNEQQYIRLISKDQFDMNDIIELYAWKNGKRLSKSNQNSLSIKIISKIGLINMFKSSPDFSLVNFKSDFENVSAVWKVFLLHIIQPDKYPMYDQNVHRAFLFINNENYSGVSNKSMSNRVKEQFYFKRYMSFIKNNDIENLRELDKSLFAFGQFINIKNQFTLLD